MFRKIIQLEAYYWVARLGSFQAAATHLGVTQPSISIRIRELEQYIGNSLFARDGRGASLTEQGRAIFKRVEGVISLLQGLDGQFRHASPLRGLIRLGMPDSFALCGLPFLLRLLKSSHPDLNVVIDVDNSHRLAGKLEDDLLDLAILAQPEITSAFCVESLGRQALVWVAHPDFGLPRRVLTPEDLKDACILTNPSPSPSFAVVMDWFASGGLTPIRLNLCNSIAAIVLAAAEGEALTALPLCVMKPYIAQGRLEVLEVDPFLPKMKMFAAYKRGVPAQGMKQLVSVIREAIKETHFVG